MNSFFSKVAFAFFASCLGLQGLLVADEIIISGNEHAVSVGDFNFSPCNTESHQGALAVLSEGCNGEMTAGDLWKFFSDNGINSGREFNDLHGLGSWPRVKQRHRCV